MIKLGWIILGLVLMTAAPALPQRERAPVLLELFTSEGCSSCPPADRLLAELDHRSPVASADVIVLSEHVDYWDNNGWKDRFSSPRFSARQQRYAERLHLDSVYTPQVVVDGAREAIGSDRQAILAAIAQAARVPKVPVEIARASRTSGSVEVRVRLPGVGPAQGTLRLYVALAQNTVRSGVMRGENAGSVLSHTAVCRSLIDAGSVAIPGESLRDVTLQVPQGVTGGLRVIAFLEDPATGRIAGVAQQSL